MQDCEAAGSGDSGLYPGAAAETGEQTARAKPALQPGDPPLRLPPQRQRLLGHRGQRGAHPPQQLLRQRARLHHRRVHRRRPPGLPAGLRPDREQQLLLEQLQPLREGLRRRARPCRCRSARACGSPAATTTSSATTASGTTGAAARCSSRCPTPSSAAPAAGGNEQAAADAGEVLTSFRNKFYGNVMGRTPGGQARPQRHRLLVGQLRRQHQQLLVRQHRQGRHRRPASPADAAASLPSNCATSRGHRRARRRRPSCWPASPTSTARRHRQLPVVHHAARAQALAAARGARVAVLVLGEVPRARRVRWTGGAGRCRVGGPRPAADCDDWTQARPAHSDRDTDRRHPRVRRRPGRHGQPGEGRATLPDDTGLRPVRELPAGRTSRRGFKLYKLYTRAAAFRKQASEQAVTQSGGERRISRLIPSFAERIAAREERELAPAGHALLSGPARAPRAGLRPPHAVPARPRPDRAQQGVPPAQAQDPGVHLARGRPLPHAADPHARGVRHRPQRGPGAGAERGPDRGHRAGPRPGPPAVRAHRRARPRRAAGASATACASATTSTRCAWSTGWRTTARA